MTRWFRDWRFLCVIGLTAILIAYLLRGFDGLFGITLGLVGTLLNLYAMRWATIVLGKSIKEEQMPKGFSVGAVIAFLLKLPLLIGLGFWANSWGPDAMTCFLIGLLLVYFCLVGWALAEG